MKAQAATALHQLLLPESLADLSPFTRVVEASGTHLAAYSGHYGVRIPSTHAAGKWSRPLPDFPFEPNGPNCAHLCPDMTVEPNGVITDALCRKLVYAVGAANGMTAVSRKHTPPKQRGKMIEARAILVLGEDGGGASRLVIKSGEESDRGNRLGGVCEEFAMTTHLTTAEAESKKAKCSVGLNASYLIEIMNILGGDIQVWTRGSTDGVGLRSKAGEAVIMPVRL